MQFYKTVFAVADVFKI